MRRRFATICAAVLVLGVAVSQAQQSATLKLKSGTTLVGELVDLGGVGFTFRVGNDERRIPADQVAEIDFGGAEAPTPAAAVSLSGGQSLVLLRNGQTFQGELYDVGGTTPLRLTFRTATGEREVSSDQVRRIYLRPVTASAAAAAATPAGRAIRTVTVSARTAWTATGVTVRRGETVDFEATGTIGFTPRNDQATPAGSTNRSLFDTKAPLPSASQGALIGRVGSTRFGGRTGGQVFLIGDRTSVAMPADGELFLGVNDSGLNDNSGSFQVKISTE